VFRRILLPPSSGHKNGGNVILCLQYYKVLCLKIPHIVFRIDIFSTGVQIKMFLLRVIFLPALQSSVGS
jgi:hypothetical protein